ncbi:hypothetical protein EL84_25895 [Paenibacillus sp. VT-400]|uniref:DUF3892 domain-containing protein n=1 Tax=Paenibacillus sp. VT-400 TaxID=1495853 RepID=UPI00064939D2|nr:DUF3892 domain-containing protein [Paenibacillus sp. VT-400]KLU55478.1 hypothetical protein EL84_25895 [Paenibacillus sp. VT-400]
MPNSNRPRLEVIKESETGLNQKFRDNKTGETLTRGQVADRIKDYPDYHVMRSDGRRIIRSNPDSSRNNNLD